jgi:hypothetical protein
MIAMGSSFFRFGVSSSHSTLYLLLCPCWNIIAYNSMYLSYYVVQDHTVNDEWGSTLTFWNY